MEEHDVWTVGEVAEMVGVSVRTLHHWDAIGLASPSWRSSADYRLYDDSDIARVHNILLYRETGMALKDIQALLDSGEPAESHLRRQLSLLRAQAARVTSKIEAVQLLLEEDMIENKPLSAEERAAVLGSDWNPEWEKEAEQKWGDTQDWEVSQQRVAAMGAQDFAAAKEELDALEAECADALRSGVQPGSERANELAEKHRENLSQWFPVSVEKQVLIAQGYVADERFRQHYDRREAGLAEWLKSCIDANAARHGVDPQQAQWR